MTTIRKDDIVELLFLDEPTAGLDPLMQRKFFDLIRQENAGGVTVFFSSHILSEVQRLCTRVAIIREGRIVEISDIRTLQKNNQPCHCEPFFGDREAYPKGKQSPVYQASLTAWGLLRRKERSSQ